MLAQAVLKACRCCGATYTADQWAALPELGIQRWPWGEVQQLKNCPCSSTLALVLIVGEPEVIAA